MVPGIFIISSAYIKKKKKIGQIGKVAECQVCFKLTVPLLKNQSLGLFFSLPAGGRVEVVMSLIASLSSICQRNTDTRNKCG